MRQGHIRSVLLQLGVLLAALIGAGLGFFCATRVLMCVHLMLVSRMGVSDGQRMGTEEHVATEQPGKNSCVPGQARTHNSTIRDRTRAV